jgi:membrane protease YdiL (CAAX protease family)
MEKGYEQQDWYLYFAYILPQIAFAVVALIALRYQKRSVLQTAKNQTCKIKYLFMALLLQIGLFSLSELNTLFMQFLQSFGYTPQEIFLPSMDGMGFVGTLIAVALLPAIFEELFFRGVLLEGLKPLGETSAALICGALFALYHQNPPQTVYQFCCGTAFAFVALRSESILPTALAHFLNNAVILVLYKLSKYHLCKQLYILLVLYGILFYH